MAEIAIKDAVTPQLRAMFAECKNPRAALKNAAAHVAKLLRGHFRQNQMRGNRLGGESTQFWNRAAQRVYVAAEANSAVIYGTQKGVRLQIEGGVVRKKNKAALTIPVSHLSHGKSVADFRNAGNKPFKIRSKRGNDLLAIRTGDDGIEPIYLLRASARVRGDKTLRPSDDAIRARLHEGVALTLKHQHLL